MNEEWFEIEERVKGAWTLKTFIRGRRGAVESLYRRLSKKTGRRFRVGAAFEWE